MPQTPSPLRYPGGKTSILDMVSTILKNNDLLGGHYAEPYAGGAGLALSLLFHGYTHEIHLNDLDKSIWSFWHSIINNTDDFIEKINTTPVTIDEWLKQREIQNNKDNVTVFDLGFSTFFLNRTNRSGVILKAGVIGGLQQNSDYKIDCRFHKENLIKRIKRIEKYKHRIHIYNNDALDFIKKIDLSLPEKSLFCIDPPYYNKGSTLYTNFYIADDHTTLSKVICDIAHPWILTYDDAPEIQSLYNKNKQYKFNLNYSAAIKRIGTELLVVSDEIKIVGDLKVTPVSSKNIAA
ncbi:DNA adenine methylase [Yersinia thracica]|uniref:DNA adenine methylase n=1 Tax=Yersinia thracica TaxID=2890319 RepID=UPI00119E1B31|nr:DNA adenine methylase [Yersinia thracica]